MVISEKITSRMRDHRQGEWLQALLHALPLMVLVFSLFYYWFAIVNRHVVFLYYHDMGSFVPSTSPFSRITASRYWMSGLVAGGFVMVLYVCANWLLGRLMKDYRAPVWWRVWIMAAPALFVTISLVTITVNEPTLPLAHALPTALAAVLAMALAIMPGKMAVERPWRLLLLLVDGSAMGAVISALSMIERVRWMLGRGTIWPMLLVGGILGGAMMLLVMMTALRVWRRTSNPTTWELFAAGLCVAYLFMPLLHHVGFTDGYYYVSDADNFFAKRWAFQIAAWLLAAMVAVGVTRLRGYLIMRGEGARRGRETRSPNRSPQ